MASDPDRTSEGRHGMSVFPTIPTHPSLLPPDDDIPAASEPRVRLVLIKGEGGEHEAAASPRSIRTA
jgi:hypothetical protein